MASKFLLLFCAIVAVAQSKSVIVGLVSDQNGYVKMVEQKAVERNSIPFVKRTDELEFFTPGQIIKGIAIKDLENGLAEPSITRGGLGFNFANIKLKSERSSGYKYVVEVYA